MSIIDAQDMREALDAETARAESYRARLAAISEPTDAMYAAGIKFLRGRVTVWSVADLYRAMVAAA